MKKTNRYLSKRIIILIAIIFLFTLFYNYMYIYKINYKYNEYFTKEINQKIRNMKNDIEYNTKILYEIIKKKSINKKEWDILFNGYRTLHSNISTLRNFIEYTRLKPQKYKEKINIIAPYAEYYKYFLTSNMRFKFKNNNTIYLNENDIKYFTAMLHNTNLYLNILKKYDSMHINVNDDSWIILIKEINRID